MGRGGIKGKKKEKKIVWGEIKGASISFTRRGETEMRGKAQKVTGGRIRAYERSWLIGPLWLRKGGKKSEGKISFRTISWGNGEAGGRGVKTTFNRGQAPEEIKRGGALRTPYCGIYRGL